MKKSTVLFLWSFTIFFVPSSYSQIGINTVSLASNIVVSGGTASLLINSHPASVNGVTPSTNYTVNYNNNGNASVIDFNYSSKTYVKFCDFDTIIIRRVANAWEPTNGNKQHIFCQGPGTVDNTNHIIPFPISYPQVSGHAYMERAIKEGYINRGSDNVFNNDATSDQTFTNIERVDFVYKPGMSADSAFLAGFLIAERGGNDPFKIVAITGIDANGNPTSFGTVLSVTTASYGAGILSAPTFVMRKDAADNTLRPFSLVPSQAIRTIFVRFSDLGVANAATIYGYTLMGYDVTATTTAQLLNYTNNTYFPQNTTTANGGMDMAAAPGTYHTDQVLDMRSLDLSGEYKNGGQYLLWDDKEYLRVEEYRLQKSFDGQSFNEIASVRQKGYAVYSFEDKDFNSSCYYRVKVMMTDGSHFYSSIISAKKPGNQPSVTLYPNPANDQLIVSFDGNHTQHKQVSIISVDGKQYGKWAVNDNVQVLKLDISALPAGHYFVKMGEKTIFPKAFHFVKQ